MISRQVRREARLPYWPERLPADHMRVLQLEKPRELRLESPPPVAGCALVNLVLLSQLLWCLLVNHLVLSQILPAEDMRQAKMLAPLHISILLMVNFHAMLLCKDDNAFM